MITTLEREERRDIYWIQVTLMYVHFIRAFKVPKEQLVLALDI